MSILGKLSACSGVERVVWSVAVFLCGFTQFLFLNTLFTVACSARLTFCSAVIDVVVSVGIMVVVVLIEVVEVVVVVEVVLLVVVVAMLFLSQVSVTLSLG